jgi:hypothetical protein
VAESPPAAIPSFRYDAENDSYVPRNGFKPDVEAVAIDVCPGAADATPVVVAAFAIANIVGEMAGRPRNGGFGFDGLISVMVMFSFKFQMENSV